VKDKLLIVDVAALGWKMLSHHGRQELAGFSFRPMETVFPAVTCTVQGSFRTATAPGGHGMVSNGLYFRNLRKVMFWEQSAGLVAGPRIWQPLRRRGGRVGMFFWQQSLGEDVDAMLSPAPIHKHHGGMIEDCYCRPGDLYGRLCGRIGSPFRLRNYWGPLASAKVGDWIAAAGQAVMADEQLALDVCLLYLPSLDYDLQRAGPYGRAAAAALRRLEGQLALLAESAGRLGWRMVVFGDYAIEQTRSPAVLPNLALREAGLLAVRRVGRMTYLDFHASRAFAMVDHELAHVFIRDEADVEPARAVLAGCGAGEILDAADLRRLSIEHPNCGELVVLARPGSWLAYPWWRDRREVPDYASHMDIHNKPGYDPCELFFGWPPMSVGRDVSRVCGTHGRAGPDRPVAWASNFDMPAEPKGLLDLAEMTAKSLE